MPLIVILIVTAVAAGIYFNKTIYDTLPVSVFLIAQAVYVMALFMPLNIAVWVCVPVCMLSVLIVVAYIRVSEGGGKSIWSLLRAGLNKVVGNPLSMAPFLAICALFLVVLADRKVFYYDDLSYWGLYTKNIFYINKLPFLFENCSVNYKDYPPIMQILQYLAMFGRKSFSEPVMFQTNVCFIYIILLPMLSVINKVKTGGFAKVAIIVFYIIFPHVLTSQFYYRLGVDLYLALTFGYVIYSIIQNDDDLFRLLSITIGSSFLALIKSSGIVLSLLAIIMFIIWEILKRRYSGVTCEKKGLIPVLLKTAVILLFTLGSYFSWQLFLRYSWNNGYLSNRVKDGIKGGGFSLPPYTGEVIRNYVNHFFTYPLTRNRFGVTAFLLVIFIVAVYTVNIVNSRRSGENTGLHTAMLVMSMSGLVIFCVAHISMYLFVFDEWEAHGLMEYDRYITQYLGGVFYVYVCMLLRVAACSGGKFKNMAGVVTAASLLIFIALLPYADIKEYLVPANYKAMLENGYAQMSQTAADEWGSSGIREMNLAHDGTQRLTVIANEWDETTQFIEYEAVPQPIDRILNVPAVEEGKLADTIDDYLESYLYVARGSKASYVGNWRETAEFTEDNMPLLEGTLYQVNRLNDVKTLTPVHRNIGDFSY